MRVFHGFDHLPHFRRPIATVGSFDGIHGGHMRLLNTVIRTAQEQKGESIVLTFDPHPRVTLGCAEGLRLLTTTEEKAYLLERAGIDNLIIIPFDTAFSRLTPYDFVHNYLIDKVGITNLVVGYNHHFGHDKVGNYDYLDRLHNEFGCDVIRVAEYDSDSEKVSSTVLRRLIEQGDMVHAGRMMPHPYLLIGTADGAQIHISELLKLLPPAGTYLVSANGTETLLTIDHTGTIITNLQLPTGKTIITF